MPGVNKLPQNRKLASLLYRRIYHSLNIKLIITGSPSKEPALWVCNHISWIDILLLAGNHTVDFIAKSDVGKWPFIGHLVRKSGTLLIDRDNKFQAYRSLPLLQQRLTNGIPVIIFPEGTTTVGATTAGATTLPFKPMFYEAAVRENAVIQPIALYYLEGNSANQTKKITDSVAFIDQDSIGSSLRKILQQHEIIAHLHFLPVISAHQYHRKTLAKTSQQEINNVLNHASNNILS
jgi:1-acyl-sn-glycerol-3-phosphate acyltransferase